MFMTINPSTVYTLFILNQKGQPAGGTMHKIKSSSKSLEYSTCNSKFYAKIKNINLVVALQKSHCHSSKDYECVEKTSWQSFQ